MNSASPKQFTGRHMLAIMIAFFGVIIAVNVGMAIVAHTSWTGLVVKNTYVASQKFNEKMADTRNQAKLRWSGIVTVSNGVVGYRIVDANSQIVPVKSVTMKFMRPVDDREDRSEMLVATPDGGHQTIIPLADGAWLVEIDADAGLDKPFRETLRMQIVKGARQ